MVGMEVMVMEAGDLVMVGGTLIFGASIMDGEALFTEGFIAPLTMVDITTHITITAMATETTLPIIEEGETHLMWQDGATAEIDLIIATEGTTGAETPTLDLRKEQVAEVKRVVTERSLQDPTAGCDLLPMEKQKPALARNQRLDLRQDQAQDLHRDLHQDQVQDPHQDQVQDPHHLIEEEGQVEEVGAAEDAVEDRV
jgi:hypothetical protein